jgi:hypothetical protein
MKRGETLVRLAAFAASALLIASPGLAQQQPTTPDSWQAAQRVALEEIYEDHQLTFYCNCAYALDGTLLEGACGYEARSPTTSSGEGRIASNGLMSSPSRVSARRGPAGKTARASPHVANRMGRS